MGVYVYALSKSTKKVYVDGAWQALPYFRYSYKDSSWFDAQTERIIASKMAAARRAFDHHTKDGLVLALDGECVVLARVAAYHDGPAPEDIHATVLGRVERVGRGLHCVAQNTTEDLARCAAL